MVRQLDGMMKCAIKFLIGGNIVVHFAAILRCHFRGLNCSPIQTSSTCLRHTFFLTSDVNLSTLQCRHLRSLKTTPFSNCVQTSQWGFHHYHHRNPYLEMSQAQFVHTNPWKNPFPRPLLSWDGTSQMWARGHLLLRDNQLMRVSLVPDSRVESCTKSLAQSPPNQVLHSVRLFCTFGSGLARIWSRPIVFSSRNSQWYRKKEGNKKQGNHPLL